jgi:hypothetical protein
MPWFKVDDVLHSHPKARSGGTAAMGLWVLAGSHAAQYLTDGFVPEWYVKSWPNGSKLARQLVDARLWDAATDDHGKTGWQFRDWADYQPSREEVEADREATRDRQRKFRQARRDQRRASQNESTDKAIRGMRNGVTNGVTNGVSHDPPYPSRPEPDPTRPLSSSNHLGNGGGSKQREDDVTPPQIQACGKAHDDDKPCRPCGEARKQSEADALKAKRDQRSTEAKKRARVAHAAITACNFCNAKGYTPGGKPCHHDLDDGGIA